MQFTSANKRQGDFDSDSQLLFPKLYFEIYIMFSLICAYDSTQKRQIYFAIVKQHKIYHMTFPWQMRIAVKSSTHYLYENDRERFKLSVNHFKIWLLQALDLWADAEYLKMWGPRSLATLLWSLIIPVTNWITHQILGSTDIFWTICVRRPCYFSDIALNMLRSLSFSSLLIPPSHA